MYLMDITKMNTDAMLLILPWLQFCHAPNYVMLLVLSCSKLSHATDSSMFLVLPAYCL